MYGYKTIQFFFPEKFNTAKQVFLPLHSPQPPPVSPGLGIGAPLAQGVPAPWTLTQPGHAQPASIPAYGQYLQ